MKNDLNAVPRISIRKSFFEWRELMPVLVSFSFLVLFFVVLKFSWAKLSEQRRTISELKKNNSFLLEKKNKLEKANEGVVSLFFDSSYNFLPLERPILATMTAVKNLLDDYLIFTGKVDVSLVSTDSGEKDLVMADVIRIEISGNFEQINSFLNKIESVIPLMSFRGISLSSEEGLLAGELQLLSLWSPYYTPSIGINTPLPDITDSEKMVLDKASTFEKIESYQKISPAGPYERGNPFFGQ